MGDRVDNTDPVWREHQGGSLVGITSTPIEIQDVCFLPADAAGDLGLFLSFLKRLDDLLFRVSFPFHLLFSALAVRTNYSSTTVFGSCTVDLACVVLVFLGMDGDFYPAAFDLLSLDQHFGPQAGPRVNSKPFWTDPY